MKLLHATFVGLRGVVDASFDLDDPATGRAADVVVVRGGGASGRTRWLEAVVLAKELVAPYGPEPWIEPWVRDGVAARARLAFELDDEERCFAGTRDRVLEADVTLRPSGAEAVADEGLRAVLARYSHGAGAGKIEYVPASRWLDPRAASGALSPEAQRRLRPSRRPDKYAFVPALLRELEPGDADARAFAARLAALSPTCRFEPAGERCLRSRGGPLATVHEVSDAERDAAILAATSVAIDLRCSMVLLDKPDRFVAAEDAARFARGLGALGEDNQLVLAPASPAVSAAFAGARVVAIEEVSAPW